MDARKMAYVTSNTAQQIPMMMVSVLSPWESAAKTPIAQVRSSVKDQ